MINLEELDCIKDPMARLMVKYAVLVFLIACDECLDDFLKKLNSVCLPIGGYPPGADDNKV